MTGVAEVYICAIAKAEDDYINEWIDYHLALGVAHIFIYDNHYVPRYTSLALAYPREVSVVHLPGTCMQMTAYAHFQQYIRQSSILNPPTWVGFIDIDEFIVLRGPSAATPGIADWMKEWAARCPTPPAALGLNWVLFGNNGHDTYDRQNPSVLRRFTRRQCGVNPHIKSIVRLDALCYMESPHHAVYKDPTLHHTYDPEGKLIPPGPYHPTGSDCLGCIHHYFTKSTEEFSQKCMRGRADIPEFRNMEADFKAHNFNDIEDLTAVRFLYPDGASQA